MLGGLALAIGGALMACINGSLGTSMLIALVGAFWIFWHTERALLSYGYMLGYWIAIQYFVPDAWILMGVLLMVLVLTQIGTNRFIPQKTLLPLCAIIAILSVVVFFLDATKSSLLYGINIAQREVITSLAKHAALEGAIVWGISIGASYGFRIIRPQKTSYLVA